MAFRNSGRAVAAVALALSFAFTGNAARADNILIKNVTLYDGTGKAAVSGANVLVKGDKIVTVSTGKVSAAGAKVIDGTGKFLMPGLWDSHVHIRGGQGGSVLQGAERKPIVDREAGLSALHSYLYMGVTSVYDSGNNPDFIYPLRADEQAGKIMSPHIFAAGGTISVPGGYGAGLTALKIANWDQGQKDLAAKITREKPDMLKFILDRQGNGANKAVPTMSEDIFKKATGLAASMGVRSTVHISAEWDAEMAINNGVAALAHPVLRAVNNDSFIKELADKKVPVSTTMAVFFTIARVADDPSFFDEEMFKATTPAEELVKSKTEERQRYIGSGMSATFKLMQPYAMATIKKMQDGGVLLTAGTDRTVGPMLHMELELLNQAGIKPVDIIKIATLNSAIYLGREKDMGSVEQGKIADLLLLDADPAANVRNFRAINTVIKGGKKIDRSKLDLPVNHKEKK